MRLINSIATVLTFISVIQAQNTNSTTTGTNSTVSSVSTESYPAEGGKPVPKPEWLELIKSANITNAPVLKSNGNNGKTNHKMLSY